MDGGFRLGRMWPAAAMMALAVASAAALGPKAVADPIPLAQVPPILDVAADRDDPAYVFLATHAGVYRAGPDGSAVRVSVGNNNIWDLAPHPSPAAILYARGVSDDGGSRGVIISKDAGRTWRPLPERGGGPGYFRRIAISETDPNILYGLRHDLWMSHDGGLSWARNGSPAYWSYDIAVSSLDARTVYVSTPIGLRVTTDGGQSWNDAGLCRQPVTAIETGPSGTVYAFSLCQGLLRGSGPTGKWAVVNDEFDGCIVQHLAVNPQDSDQLYAVERCHKVLVSADGGRTWRILGRAETWQPLCETKPHGRPESDDRESQKLKTAETGSVG